MTAQDVASAVCCIGPPYKAYEQSIVDNGIDGKTAARLVQKPEAHALNFLASLGMSPLHGSRVLLEFESLTQP